MRLDQGRILYDSSQYLAVDIRVLGVSRILKNCLAATPGNWILMACAMAFLDGVVIEVVLGELVDFQGFAACDAALGIAGEIGR